MPQIGTRQSSVPSSVSPLATKGHYPVIFEDAGQLALSNAFIHVLIPLNLTRVKSDIMETHSILLTALQKDRALFTKDSFWDRLIVSETAEDSNSTTFMTRLNDILYKFNHVCHLLPDSKGFHIDEGLFLAHPDLIPLATLRKKRNIALLLPLLKEAVGTFWGLFGKSALSSLMSSVASGSRPPNVLLSLSKTQILNASAAVQKVLSTIFKTQTLMYSDRQIQRMYPVYAEVVNMMEAQVTKVINVIQQLHNHRLAVDWLDSDELQKIHHSVIRFAKDSDIFPLTSAYSDYFQLDTSYIRDGFDVTAILHVPCTVGRELLSLMRFVPAPIPIPLQYRSFPSIEDAILHSNHSQIVESFPEALFIRPEAEYLAIGSSNSYKLLTTDELSACIRRNKVYICDKPNFLKTKLSHSCVGAIYEKNKRAAMIHCQYEKRPFTETIFQIELSTFIVFSPERFTARFSCRTSSHTADITAASRVYVAPDCSLQLKDHILLSSNHYTITGLTEIYDWDFNPLEAPSGRLLDNEDFDFPTTEPTPNNTLPYPIIPANAIHSTQAIISIGCMSIIGVLYPLFLFCRSCSRHLSLCLAAKPHTQSIPLKQKTPKPTPRFEPLNTCRLYSNTHKCEIISP